MWFIFLIFIIMNIKVPKGLTKCPKCNYYKGITKDHRGSIKVSCACHNQICERCGEKVYEFPIGSTIYDEDRGLLHVPVFCAWSHRCPDGVQGQLKNSFLIDSNGNNLLNR